MPSCNQDVPERIFMNSLIKHTGIALAIIVPLAAYATFAEAATGVNPSIFEHSHPTSVLLQSDE